MLAMLLMEFEGIILGCGDDDDDDDDDEDDAADDFGTVTVPDDEG
jgi:hypothetical protein